MLQRLYKPCLIAYYIVDIIVNIIVVNGFIFRLKHLKIQIITCLQLLSLLIVNLNYSINISIQLQFTRVYRVIYNLQGNNREVKKLIKKLLISIVGINVNLNTRNVANRELVVAASINRKRESNLLESTNNSGLIVKVELYLCLPYLLSYQNSLFFYQLGTLPLLFYRNSVKVLLKELIDVLLYKPINYKVKQLYKSSITTRYNRQNYILTLALSKYIQGKVS